MSRQRKNKKQTPAQYAANHNRIRKHRKVKCINNETIYNSVKDAADKLNLRKSSVISAANGQKPSIKGYRFEYIGEYSIIDNRQSFSLDQNSGL